MTKRKSGDEADSEDHPMSSRFSEDDMYDDEAIPAGPDQAHFRGKKFKNSLDSDEEDDEVEATKYNMLDPEDLDGQEEGTIERDGEITITPFNMDEELEEGHFDKDGTYIFRKEDVIKDSWLDNIDWIKLKEQKTPVPVAEESDDSEGEDVDCTDTYKAMLEIMQPKETVQKALQRLGGKNKTASSRWKKKNQSEPTEDERQNKEKMLELTSLADKLVSLGNMDIYQQSYERLNFLVIAKTNPPPKFDAPSEPAADMFADDFDAEKVASVDAQNAAESSKSEKESASDSEVKWEFKWENNDEAEIYGPHPTSEIMRWIEEGYFKDGVWVRKVGESNAPFYSSNRVDFELYT